MELKDVKEKKNLVFDRREIEATISSESSPTNKEIIILIAKKLSVPENAVKINGIYSKFGSKEFKIIANIYKSKEDKNKIERKTKKEIETEKKEAEDIKEAKKAEKEKKKGEVKTE